MASVTLRSCTQTLGAPFPSESFDVAISRSGTMFFSDPVAAFANIGQALRSDGRLVMMVWQAHDRNEWSVAIAHALAGDGEFLPAAPHGSDPFRSPTQIS